MGWTIYWSEGQSLPWALQDWGAQLLLSHPRGCFGWIQYTASSQESASTVLLWKICPLRTFPCSGKVPWVSSSSGHAGSCCVCPCGLLMWQVLMPWGVTMTENSCACCESAFLPSRMPNQIPFSASRMKFNFCSTWESTWVNHLAQNSAWVPSVLLLPAQSRDD